MKELDKIFRIKNRYQKKQIRIWKLLLLKIWMQMTNSHLQLMHLLKDVISRYVTTLFLNFFQRNKFYASGRLAKN